MIRSVLLLISLLMPLNVQAGIVRIEVDRTVTSESSTGSETRVETAILTGVCIEKVGLRRYWVATAAHAFSAQHSALRVHGYEGKLLKKSLTHWEDIAIVEVVVEADDWDITPLGKDAWPGQPAEFVGYALGSPIGKPVSVKSRTARHDTVEAKCQFGHSGSPLFTWGERKVCGIVTGYDTVTLQTIVTPVSRLKRLIAELKE